MSWVDFAVCSRCITSLRRESILSLERTNAGSLQFSQSYLDGLILTSTEVV